MDKQTEKRELIKTAIKTCIAIETSGGEFDGNRLTKQILRVLNELGVVMKVDGELPKSPLDKAELFDAFRRQYRLGNFIFDDLYRRAHNTGFAKCQEDMASYVAVEPLIEVK